MSSRYYLCQVYSCNAECLHSFIISKAMTSSLESQLLIFKDFLFEIGSQPTKLILFTKFRGDTS